MDVGELLHPPQPYDGDVIIPGSTPSAADTDRELLASTSVLQELNMGGGGGRGGGAATVEAMFDMRRMIYDNQEAFYGDVQYKQDASRVSPELIARCTAIETAMHEGTRLLVDSLRQHTHARQAVTDIQAQGARLDAACRKVAVAVNGLRDCIFASADLTPLLVKGVDELLQRLGSVKEAGHAELESSGAPHREQLRSTAEVLSRLASTYQFKRCADVTYQCPLCLHRPVERFLTPCGHTFCKDCTPDLLHTSALCPMCRVPWNNVGNLYFQ